jgi:type II secretory pathway component PulK
VLLAALALVAFLSVLVTLQLERVPVLVRESRGTAVLIQCELDVQSALQLAIGILREDARAGHWDGFGDVWARPHAASVGGAEIAVRISDWAFSGLTEDRWVLHDAGIPEGVTVLAAEDPYVRGLFARVRPNVNTAPLAALSAAGLSADAVRWIGRTRQQSPLAGLDDLAKAPDYSPDRYRPLLDGVSVTSNLFLVEATIRRAGEKDRQAGWVLWRNGRDVRVVCASVCRAAP